MIAPLDQMDPKTVRFRRRLDQARRLVAATFFRHEAHPAEKAPPVPAWRAWAFVAWVVIVTAVYFATMLGLL
jgi:nitroreductase